MEPTVHLLSQWFPKSVPIGHWCAVRQVAWDFVTTHYYSNVMCIIHTKGYELLYFPKQREITVCTYMYCIWL